jgi:hypothetical protein
MKGGRLANESPETIKELINLMINIHRGCGGGVWYVIPKEPCQGSPPTDYISILLKKNFDLKRSLRQECQPLGMWGEKQTL